MRLKSEDVVEVLRILHEWETAAKIRGDVTAQAKVALLIKVITGLTGRTK